LWNAAHSLLTVIGIDAPNVLKPRHRAYSHLARAQIMRIYSAFSGHVRITRSALLRQPKDLFGSKGQLSQFAVGAVPP